MISIQALRALAAIAVIFCHYDYVGTILRSETGAFPLYPLAAGVDLFFVISGFIMVYSSQSLFGARNAWRIFLGRRITRIVPLYWLATLLAIPIMAAPSSPTDILKSLLFIPYKSPAATFFPVHAGGWTLNFEMFFYAVFACAIWLPRRFAVPAVACALTAFAALGWYFYPFQPPLFAFWADPIILEFVYGMAIAMLYRRGVRLPVTLRTLLVVAGATAIWFFHPDGTVPSGFRALQWGVPMAALFAGTVLAKDISFGPLTAPIKLLGDASYAMYLFHSMLATGVIVYWTTGPLTVYPMPLVLACGTVLSIAVPIGIFLLFEGRSTRMLRGLFRTSAEYALASGGGPGRIRTGDETVMSGRP